jgi:hypothetical protein
MFFLMCFLYSDFSNVSVTPAATAGGHPGQDARVRHEARAAGVPGQRPARGALPLPGGEHLARRHAGEPAARCVPPWAVKSLRDNPYLNALNNICNRVYL